ncbi:patatin-like phospholipase family protein [Flagellimonas sp.]|uniref:patatin-like phospholipase family protein n=1 Tax=Flagellimonas sp. TaxID=2058762 RepID=UPI003B5A5DF1
MDINSFFEAAIGTKVIAEDALTADKMNTTKSFLSAADKMLKKAIVENKKLSQKFENGFIKPEYISSGYIDDGTASLKPVIDLVQQGGGMYGIALVGYTYIMEKVGIRFHSHGGTSAGGINASFLASIPLSIYTTKSIFVEDKNTNATKSELLAHIITNTDFSSFMDAAGIIGRLQQFLFKKYKSKWLLRGFVLFALAFLLTCFGTFAGIFSIRNGLKGAEIRFFDFIIGTCSFVALLILIYILLVKLFRKDFGINSGNRFYEWSDCLFEILGIQHTQNLFNRINANKLSDQQPDDKARLVMVSSNLTHNRIVKFPERASDYWNNAHKVKPAAYLRATMSLPFIFRTFIPDVKHYYQRNGSDFVIKKARFVDGGMLSNFPIREFHRLDGHPPRFPTFGVLLSDIGLKQGRNKTERIRSIDARKLPDLKFIDYIKSYFKTFRNFYDYEFVFGSDEIAKRVVTVDTQDYNWLDFWMDEDTKKELFLKGVEAAIEQFEKFDWQEYRQEREKTDSFILKQK